MDYLTQLNAFNERCHITGTKPMVRVVYYTLLDMNNSFRWCPEFKTTVRIIAGLSGISSINTVHRCIQELVQDGLIEYIPSKVKGKKSVFKIVSLCSPFGTQTGTDTGTKTGTETGTKSGTDTGTKTATLNRVNKTKKDNNTDEEKIEYADNVKMTLKEYEKLKERFHGNETAVKKCIEILDNYKGSKGATYKNDYKAILSWVVGKYEKEYGTSRPSPSQLDFPIHQGDCTFGIDGGEEHDNTSGAVG